MSGRNAEDRLNVAAWKLAATPEALEALVRGIPVRRGLLRPDKLRLLGEPLEGPDYVLTEEAALRLDVGSIDGRGGPFPKVTRASESASSPTENLTSLVGAPGVGDSVTPPIKESPTSESAPPARQQDSRGELNPEPATPFALTLRDFVARPRERREPILADVDGRAVVGHKSLTLLGGLGGSGKTTFFNDLALHLAAGVDYPPFTVPKPIDVLVIQNEGPEDLFVEKLEARLATFPHELKGRLDVCVFDWGGFSLANDVHRERLAAEIVDKGYDLVFGDPLDSLGIEGVGSPKDTRDFMELMKLAGLNKTCAWWLNTHPRKEETREALNEISGAWGGKPDSVLLIRMLDGDRTQLRFPKLRWAKRGKRPTILLAFDPETEAFTYLREESEEERDYLPEMLELLNDGKWRTPKEIAAKTEDGGIGANVDRVKDELARNPELFESRTGAEAKALGRHPTATVWSLCRGDEERGDPSPKVTEALAAVERYRRDEAERKAQGLPEPEGRV